MILLMMILGFVTLWVVFVAWMIGKDCARWRLFTQTPPVARHDSEAIGLTVVCSGVRSVAQIDNLLSVEYARYEVIVVVDALNDGAAFERIVRRYRMMRVGEVEGVDFPHLRTGVVWRSRTRCNRRLVLLDRPRSCAANDLTAATELARYEWVMPLRGGARLLPDAVMRLVALIGDRRDEVWLFRTRIGEAVDVVWREVVVRGGGFTRQILKTIPAQRRRWFWMPMMYHPKGWRLSVGSRVAWSVMGLLLAGLFAGVGSWVLCVMAVEWAWVMAVSAVALQMVEELFQGQKVRLFGGWGVGGKLSVKNFTIS